MASEKLQKGNSFFTGCTKEISNFDIDCKKSVIKTLFKGRCIEVLKRAKNRKIRLNSQLHMHTFYECSANVQCFLKMYVNSTALKWYYCDF